MVVLKCAKYCNHCPVLLTTLKKHNKINPNSSSPVIIERRQGEKIKEFMTALKKAAGLTGTKWVVWEHIQVGKSHCETCLKLNKCWFIEEKKPKLPQHFLCHCTTKPISYTDVVNFATSNSDSSKFDPYLFNRGMAYSHNKQKLFESWGYTIDDADWLQKTIEEQGVEKYINGDYDLGLLNKYGQRINIRVEIPRKDKEGTVPF